VDTRQMLDDLVHLRDDDAAAEGGCLYQRPRVLGVWAGIEIAVVVGLVGDDERDIRRKIDHHAGVKFEIGVDRADLERAGLDQLRELAALRAGESEIEAPRDAALEDG